MLRVALLFTCLFLITTAWAEDTQDNTYIVWADKLNLRDVPSTNANVVVVLGRGDQVIVDRKNSERKSIFPNENPDSFCWQKVSFNDKEGWVADSYILSSDYYSKVLTADEYGRAGRNTEMMAELTKLPGSYRDVLSISPDRQKAVYYLDSMQPSVLFCADEGIAAVLDMDWSKAGWSSDSRFFVYSTVLPGCSFYRLNCYDTEKRKGSQANLSRCQMGEFEVIGKYVIWMALDDPQDIGEYKAVYVPSLKICDLDTNMIKTILKPDEKTMRLNKMYNLPEVMLVPDEAMPPEVTASKIYLKHVNQYMITGITEG